MNPTQATQSLVSSAGDALFVASLGTATSALRAVTDDGPHLYMGGAMGSALAVALGVAEKRPDRRVVALLGDGETLMGAGSLWSLAAARGNVTAAILCDGHYSITGGQPLGATSSFADVARTLGLTAATATTPGEIATAIRQARPPALIELVVAERDWPGPSPFVDPPVVRWRFERAAAGAA